MNVAAFSTGISIRWPHADRMHAAATVGASPFADDLPSPSPSAAASASHRSDKDDDNVNAVKKASDEQQQVELPKSTVRAATYASKSDEESYGACQELAYQYAVEQTKSAVRTVLLKANTNCYHQVLKYFDKYMSASTSKPVSATTPSLKSALDSLVAFPEFHGFPTAAIVAGTDATFSEVWVNPLCQVLQRSFPLIFVVREDFQNARRIVEWMVEQLDAVKRARKSEEAWLMDLIDAFDMLESPAEAAEKAETHATGRLASLRDRSTLSLSLRGGYARDAAAGGDAISSKKQRRRADGDDNDNDDDFVGLEDDEDSDDDDDSDSDSGGWKRSSRRKRKRSKAAAPSSAAAGTQTYLKWTMEQLLVRIQTDLEVLMGENDPFKMWIATLCDLVDVKLDSELQSSSGEGDLEHSLKCYNEAIDWLKKRIVACRSLPCNINGSSATLGQSTSVKVCSTEFSLAQILHQVMSKFLAFLDDSVSAATDQAASISVGESDLHAVRITKECELLNRWRRRMTGFLKRHEDYYQLHHYNAEQYKDDPRKPFFLICIEQLEAFNQQVLDDFLVIWTNFSRQSVLATEGDDDYQKKGSIAEIGSRMGFILGVASSASPALRHLNLSIVSQIDMQFFSLEDSRKCFDDILEALIVDTNLPLCLSGDVMRWVAGRHRTTQSITMFIHALEFLFFTHFKHVKWSFLSHFCLEAHWNKPLQSVLAPSKRIAQWMRRTNFQASTMHDYLLLFSDPKLDQLRQLVFPVVKPDGDWLEVLLDEVAWLREQRANWAVGWKCFRAACSWLDITLQGDEFTSYLASALDGKLANTTMMHVITQKLERCSFRIVSCLIEDWKAICQSSSASGKRGSPKNSEEKDDHCHRNPLSELVTLLGELVLLCHFVMQTYTQPTTQKMLPKFRQEIKNAFSDKLIVGLVQSPCTRLRSSQQVLQWMTVTDVETLENRLHFNYYDRLKELLLEMDEGEHGGHAGGASWINDVSLAFLYYQESAGIYLSLSDWYETFADALENEFDVSGSKKKKMVKPSAEEQEPIDIETKARFLRAFCTLRHWGFVKSIGSSESDTIEKVVFI